jgi:cell shape-determining protein MreC
VFHLRFNQVFGALMFLSFLCAFVFPQRVTDLGRVQLEGIFIPVSRPAYHLANWVRGHFSHDAPQDSRPMDEIRQENLELKEEVNRLQMQVQRLAALADERQSLGDLQSLCERCTVSGTDSGNRDGLILGPTPGTVKANQAVLFSGGLAGRVERASVGAAYVRLITDPGFTVSGEFVRFVKSDQTVKSERVSALLPIVRGAGAGQMSIGNLAMKDVADAGLQTGDWVVLADDSWPNAVQGIAVGRIVSIQRSKGAALFAEIRVAPESGLSRLNDVWVMTHEE